MRFVIRTRAIGKYSTILSMNGKRHAASDETYVLPLPESENSEGIN